MAGPAMQEDEGRTEAPRSRAVRVETPWGPWEPLAPAEVATVLRGVDGPWWIAGGWALEAFAGRAWRPHEDVDVGLFRGDQGAVRRRLRGWDVRAADPPGTLRPWPEDETLPGRVHDVWVRERPDAPWRFQLVLDDRDAEEWTFRRDARIRRPVATLTWERGGLRWLAPEVQLLYEAKALRPEDRRDFEESLPHLDAPRRAWLDEALSVVHPAHEWRERLRA